MKIDQINIYKIIIPFSSDVSHSMRTGAFSNNFVVEVVSQEGQIKGYGEGAPRKYVTGESWEGVTENTIQLVKEGEFPWDLDDVDQIWNFIDNITDSKQFNSVVCALEISLLDALGKLQNKNILEYFNKDYYVDSINYGGLIPLNGKNRRIEVCRLLKGLGIDQLRIKLGKNLDENIVTIKEVKEYFGDDCDLRVDVNGGWDSQLANRHVDTFIDQGIKVVEQPFLPGDKAIRDFSEKICSSGILLMADESVCSMNDLKNIIYDGYYGMVNIRLSKCGGLRRSLNMMDYLRKEDLSFQVGCQLGETGILSAAGRILSLLSGDALYYDGSYDRYLLKENLTREDVSFGEGGYAEPLNGPGLGVGVDSDKLKRMSGSYPVYSVTKPLF